MDMKKIMMTFFLFVAIPDLYPNFPETIVTKNNSFKRVTDTTYDCTVVTGSRSIYKNVKLFALKDSAIMILKDDVSEKLLINNIRTIKFKGRGFWKGAVIGGGIGFGVGAIIGADGLHLGSDGSTDGSLGQSLAIGAVLGISFGLLGGGFGALFAEDKFYDLSKMDFVSKRNKLKYLMKENSDR